MLHFFKEQFKKIYSQVTSKLQSLFARPIDESLLQDLERILIESDAGIQTTKIVLRHIRAQHDIVHGQDLKRALEQQLKALLVSAKSDEYARVVLMVGINGAGKTTCAAKLAYYYQKQGKRVLLVAADTFRAAAVEQLKIWSEKLRTGFFAGAPDSDPAAVVFAGLKKAKEELYDMVIIDTAGRLQNKSHLMRELEKIRKVIAKYVPLDEVVTYMTIDALLGQNSLDQARLFHESTALNGVILTKMDSAAKGGIVFAIAHELGIPIVYMSFGEREVDFARFDAQTYVTELVNG